MLINTTDITYEHLQNLKLERVVIEVFGGCNYTCQMCPQGSDEGREKSFKRKMPLELFEDILDQITPKYGTPLINLEGSGEPTMAKDLAKYVEACTKRNLRTFIYCNGSKFNGQYMRDVIDAGLGLIRFSMIGYTPELYHKWMSKDNWHLIKQNIKEAKAYIKETGSNCKVETYHLILDNNKVDYEVEQYLNNVTYDLDVTSYIWKMHNWSGNQSVPYEREGKKRSCGRPLSNELTIRAGGISNGRHGAVTPCCQVLGPPNESNSVLGHFDEMNFEEIWTGEKYNQLREAHLTNNYEQLAPYCNDCDFLIDDPNVLVWTNDPNAKLGVPLGTELKTINQ